MIKLVGVYGKIKAFIVPVVFTLIFLSSVSIIGVVTAEYMANPNVPQFILEYHKVSYNHTDPYTGVIQQIDNSTIAIIVKNQPFNTLRDEPNNITTSLHYNVQVKGHYSTSWTDAFSSTNYSYPTGDTIYTWYNYPRQSSSDYTTILLPANYSMGSQVDVRLQAVVANQTSILLPNFIPNPVRGGEYIEVTVMLVVKTSDWSDPQSMTIGENSTITPTNIPSLTTLKTPNQSGSGGSILFGVDWLALVLVVLLGVTVVLLVFVVFYLRKRTAGGSVRDVDNVNSRS